MNPKVSVIILTFNRPEMLRETIDSILTQDYTNFELIIVDNHSNYDFFELLSSYEDDRIKGYQNHNNGFLAVNRNFGITKAKGEYLAFCDDDDLWSSHKLSRQVEILENTPHILLVGTNGGTFPKVRKNQNFMIVYKSSINNVQPLFFMTGLLTPMEIFTLDIY